MIKYDSFNNKVSTYHIAPGLTPKCVNNRFFIYFILSILGIKIQFKNIYTSIIHHLK